MCHVSKSALLRCAALALSLAVSPLFSAQTVDRFYERNATLDYAQASPQALGRMEQPAAFDANFHIYLCLGQSNMEGNAAIEPLDLQWVDPRFRMMAPVDQPDHQRRAGEWYVAYPPLVRDHTGLTPADYFGRTLLRHLPDSVKVGVINVAVGGCRLCLFDEERKDAYIAQSPDWLQGFCAAYGNDPYRVLADCARAAQRVGVVKGILVHQGCSDNGDTTWPHQLAALYGRLLGELGLSAAEVPLLVGELLQRDEGGACWGHNAIIDTVPQVIPTAHVVSSAGCPGKDDHLHFTADGYRLLGQRYAEAMLPLLFDK